jgi:hypothetical protein
VQGGRSAGADREIADLRPCSEVAALKSKILAVLMVPVAVLAYAIIREAGHTAACLVLGIPFSGFLRYGFLPAVHIPAEAALLSTGSLAAITLSGPAAALVAGYLLLYALWRRGSKAPASLALLAGLACYACLILDPVYYSVIPLFNVGGEPETLALATGVAMSRIQIPALVLLVLNAILTRRVVIPLVRK